MRMLGFGWFQKLHTYVVYTSARNRRVFFVFLFWKSAFWAVCCCDDLQHHGIRVRRKSCCAVFGALLLLVEPTVEWFAISRI